MLAFREQRCIRRINELFACALDIHAYLPVFGKTVRTVDAEEISQISHSEIIKILSSYVDLVKFLFKSLIVILDRIPFVVLVDPCNVSSEIERFIERLCFNDKSCRSVEIDAVNVAEPSAVRAAYGFCSEEIKTAVVVCEQTAKVFKTEVVYEVCDVLSVSVDRFRAFVSEKVGQNDYDQE